MHRIISVTQPLVRTTSVPRLLLHLRQSSTLKFSKEHEWVKVDGDVGTIGITDHAQNALGDIVFVDLPKAGAKFSAGDVFASIESVKAASDCYSPVSGTVTETNNKLKDQPNLINEAAEGNGWLMKVKLSQTNELSSLMDRAGYDKFIKQ